MKKHNGWAYRPYRPFLQETDLYICRIVPCEDSFTAYWLDAGEKSYSIYYKKSDSEDFTLFSETSELFCTVSGLEDHTDYDFYVCAGSKKSEIRKARTGKVYGTIVNYLHPQDNYYAFSGNFLCSPSILRHPDGYLLASMDLYQHDTPQNLALLFRSDDNGESWYYVNDLFPCFWPKMFIHKGVLYILACSTEYGDLLIGASYDGGVTFTEPTVLLRGTNGKKKQTGVHKNPQPVVEYNGRLYNTLEWGAWGQDFHASMVMSADVDSDLLDADSWSFSEPLRYDPEWEGVPKEGKSAGTIEGCLVKLRDGKLYNIMRYDMHRLTPKYGYALSFLVNDKDHDAPLEFDSTVNFPANHSKFEIQYDELSDRYYSIANLMTSPEEHNIRTHLVLLASPDARSWHFVCDLIDERERDPEGKKIGFQYVDFMFEGDDILYLCRTADNNAGNFHDSNYMTFHKIENFRALPISEEIL